MKHEMNVNAGNTRDAHEPSEDTSNKTDFLAHSITIIVHSITARPVMG